MTVILGGFNNRRRIVTFDWITMEYTEHNSTLIKERVRSSCSVVKNREGQKVVAIAGGATNTTGLEIWNPADDSVQLLYQFLPSEEGHKTEGLQDSRMVPINGGTEILIYGGSFGGYQIQNKIWRYSFQNDSWDEFGKMMIEREEHVVLPVDGLQCN
jgi:hypothetical protein